MKKILLIILVFLVVFSTGMPVISASEVEMVFCENFNGDLSRWVCYGNNAIDCVELYDDEKNEYISSYVVIYEKGEPLFGGRKEECILKSETFDIIPEERYTIAVDMECRIQGAANAKLVFMNEYEGILEESTFVLDGKGGGSWECSSLWVKAPENAYKAQVWLSFQSSSSKGRCGAFDNVIVCKGLVGFNNNFEKRMESSPLATENSETILKKEEIAFYDTFENGISNWSNEKKNSLKKVIISSNTMADTGYKSMRLYSGKADELIEAQSPEINIVPETEYKLKCSLLSHKRSVLTYNLPVVLKMYLKFYNEENRVVLTKSVNQTKAGKWTEEELTVVAPKDAVYLKIIATNLDGGEECYVDNVILYGKSGDEYTVNDKAKEDNIINNSVILFIDSPNASVKGVKTLIDKNDKEVKAFTKNGRTLVPVRFIAESFGAEVGWDEQTKKVTLTLPGKTAEIIIDDNKIKVNDEIFEIDTPAITERGRTMLPLRALVEKVMGKTIFWDDRGLILITDNEIVDKEKDSDIIDHLITDIKNS